MGGQPGGIYGLVSGTLKVGTAAADTATRFLQFGMPGAWAGEGCFLTGEPRRAEMRTVTPCILLHLPLGAMQQMAARDPDAIRRFAAITIGHFDVMARIIDDLLIRDADRRIAAVLERTAALSAPTLPLSQADLGAMANASRKQVNAALARFSALGWTASSYRSIEVLDAAALRAFSQADTD